MATLDDLFSSRKAGQRFLKFNEPGEAYLLVQTGEPKLVSQRDAEGRLGYMVKLEGAAKYAFMGEGTFDPEDPKVENSFVANKDIHIPVKAAGKKLKDGSADPNHEPFDTVWELTKDQAPKLKEAMLDAGVPVEEGTKYVLKLLSKDKKPYSYSVKILEG